MSCDFTLSNLAIDVPFKYRGYYHDQETSFYYLNSRYYDPYAMRFINADGYVSTGQGLNGYNMYAYCNNNPVMYVDPNGEFLIPTLLTIASSVVATTVTLGVSAVATAVPIAAVNHIISGIKYAIVDSKVEDEYTIEQATEKIKSEIGIDVAFSSGDVELVNSKDVRSRYDRIYVTKIIQNTVDDKGQKIMNRTTYGAAAEWLGHNFVYHNIYQSYRTQHTNLDYNFADNDPITKWGTVAFMVLGFL